MSRNKRQETCNIHYHYMMPMEMAPMGLPYGMNPTSVMPAMYDNFAPIPDYLNGSQYGSCMNGDPPGDPAFAGAFAGGPFFSPLLFPFFFSQRFFPFFPPFFFPFF